MNTLPVPLSVLNAHCAVLGKTGAGKSSLLRVIVEDLLRRGKRVCVIDPKGDWYGLKLSADGKSAGFPVITFGDFVEEKAADVPINEHSGKHVAELISSGNRPCVIGFRGWMPGKMTKFWIDFASTLFNSKSGELYLIGDEFHNFAPKGRVMDPEAGKSLHWSNRLLSEGRGLGLVILIASQRPQKVHNDTLTCCETLFAMRVVHAADRGAIEDWIDGCGDKEKGALVLNSIASMARGEAFVWCPEHGFGPKRIQFPMFTTFDSFAPPQLQKKISAAGWAGVDLEAVKEKLAAVIEEAKAKDPTELRRRIAALEKELKAKPVPSAVLLPPEQVNVVRDADLDVVREAIAICERTASSVQAQLKPIDSVRTELETIRVRLAAIKTNSSVLVRNADHAELRRTKPALMREVKRVIHSPREHSESNGSIPPAQQRILNGLAFLRGIGVEPADKTQLALIVGVSPTSGGYFNNLGSLRSSGLIAYPSGGTVALTDEGQKWAVTLGVPSTTEELHDAIRRKLPAAKWNIVEALIAAYPESLSKDVLAELIGVSPTSGGYFNNLGSLRSLGLIDYPQPGAVIAKPVLFLET